MCEVRFADGFRLRADFGLCGWRPARPYRNLFYRSLAWKHAERGRRSGRKASGRCCRPRAARADLRYQRRLLRAFWGEPGQTLWDCAGDIGWLYISVCCCRECVGGMDACASIGEPHTWSLPLLRFFGERDFAPAGAARASHP